MTHTLHSPAPTDRPEPGTEPPDGPVRWSGLAGLTWAALLIITNLVNVSITPEPDADVTTVTEHLVDDRTAIAWITVAFIISIPLVFLFVGGIARELSRRGAPFAAFVGILGFGGVFTMFGMTAATRLALVAAVQTGSVDPSAVWSIWKLHDVVFGFNGAAIAVVFVTVGVAAARTGLIHRGWGIAAPIGGGLLMTASLFTLQTAEGETAALAAGGLGFVTWVGFVIAAGIGLTRAGRGTL